MRADLLAPSRIGRHLTMAESRFKAEKVDGRRHIRRLQMSPCSVPGCLAWPPVDAHHERRGTGGGTGRKPPDAAALPLCVEHHVLGHQMGWATFEKKFGVDLKMVAAGHAMVSRGMGLLPKGEDE